MFLGLVKNQKFIPTLYLKDIFEIDFKAFYDAGKRLILTDLDNTLVSYKEPDSNSKLDDLINSLLKMGYEIIIVSNNKSNKRVKRFGDYWHIKYLNLALKPLKRGYKKALKLATRKYQKEEILTIGDQLLTDVFSSNRMGYTTILVDAIDRKTEVFSTKINRINEKHVLKVLKKKMPDIYKDKLARYGEKYYGI